MSCNQQGPCPRPQPKPCGSPCASKCGGCTECKQCDNIKICHFVVATLEEGKLYKNSYVIVTGEGNAVYHIDNDGAPISVSKPIIFEAEHTATVDKYRSTLVFDFTNNKAYIYGQDGTFKQWDLT